MTRQRRAKTGGEIGANGEEYKGGQFIANTDKPKSKPVKKSGKQCIELYKWEVPAEGMWSVWDRILHAFGGWEDYSTKKKIIVHPQYENTPSGKMVELWNKGQRWLSVEEMLNMGVFMPPAYLTEEQKSRNGK